MENMDAWGGREGVFVIERSPRDREGTYMSGRSREVRARQKDALREIKIDHAHVCDGD